MLIAVLAVAGGGTVGFICHRWRIDPLIITLAMGAIVNGALLVWAKGFITGTPPTWLQTLTSPASKTFGIDFPPLVAVWAVFAIVIAVFLQRTPSGRRLYATGANMRAAEMALVRTRYVWIGVFAFSALLAAVTGMLLGGFAGAADASLGTNYLWQGLTAVIIGGTAFGARGDYWRTVLGQPAPDRARHADDRQRLRHRRPADPLRSAALRRRVLLRAGPPPRRSRLRWGASRERSR